MTKSLHIALTDLKPEATRSDPSPALIERCGARAYGARLSKGLGS